MAYTLEITNGTTTYTFDVQPEFKRDVVQDFDESKSPAEVTVQTERWTLSGAVYRNATQATVTTDFQTLVTLMANKATPINSVKFKRDSSTVWDLNTTDYHVLMVTGLESEPGPGHFVNHWRGTVTVVAKKLLQGSGVSAGIIRLEKRISDTYDDAGLQRHVLEGRVETLPGTSARTKAQAQGEDSLGAAFVFVTGGTDEIEVSVQNEPEDTIATFRQEQREIGLSVPSTATSWAINVETTDGPDGIRTTITHATARGSSIANARTAVRTVKPSTGLVRVDETEGRDHLSFTATYVEREPAPNYTKQFGRATLVSVRRAVTVSGGGQNRIFDAIPGYEPYMTYGSRQPITVRERVMVRATNVRSSDDVPLPDLLLSIEHLQANDSEDTPPEVEERGEDASAHVWSRSATRVYVLPTPDGIELEALFGKLKDENAFAAEPDWIARTRATA